MWWCGNKDAAAAVSSNSDDGSDKGMMIMILKVIMTMRAIVRIMMAKRMKIMTAIMIAMDCFVCRPG